MGADEKAAIQQNLEQTLAYLEVLEKEIALLGQRMELVRGAIVEHRGAVDGIKEVMKEAEGEGEGTGEILVPLGAGVQMKGRITDATHLLVNVGSGVVIEKDPEGAIKTLEARISSYETNLENLTEQLKARQQQQQMLSGGLQGLRGQ